MYSKKRGLYFIIPCMLLLLTCGACQDKKPVNYDISKIKKEIERANKSNAKKEKDEISSYIQKKNWETTSTGTGLEYLIYENGKGEVAQMEQIATLHYSIYLLNDTLLYTSRDKKPAQFKIGRADVESGLQEAILFMRKGDKAKLLMPSHLAHGAFGDQKKNSTQNSFIIRYRVT